MSGKTKLPEMWHILYHGTENQKINSILKNGFEQYTYFAKNLSDAIEFGGLYVFEVVFPRSYAPDWFKEELCWQIRCRQAIPPDKIVKLTKYKETTLFDNETLRNEVFRRSLPYYKRGTI